MFRIDSPRKVPSGKFSVVEICICSMIFCPNRPLVKNGSSITGRYSIDSRKTSHWEVFLKNACRLFLKGAFLLQNPPLFQFKTWIEKFTRKGAFTDKVFRLLRKAAKGVASGHHHLLKKVDENFCFFTSKSQQQRLEVLQNS